MTKPMPFYHLALLLCCCLTALHEAQAASADSCHALTPLPSVLEINQGM